MRIHTLMAALALVAVPAFATAQDGSDPSRLFGRVVTTDGTVYEGYIRWDGNEAGWFDILHGDKDIPDRNRRDAERLGWEPESRERRIEIFGIGISWDEDGSGIASSVRSGIRFGHISTLEALGGDRARLILKSGEEVELDGGGDVGDDVDAILVEAPRGGQVELDWDDIDVIDFIGSPGADSRWGDRLYGTLETRDGDRFTGYVVWDMDELFTTDILDGEERGQDLEIPFSRIRSIARYSSSAARVVVDEGEELILRGSNDVDDDNRDILVADPSFGEVRVTWDELERVDFASPPERTEFGAFDGGQRIQGTVFARGGESHTGLIRWDNDEEFTWEILDGELRDGVDLDIEFGAIAAIERLGEERSRVTLRDGRAFELGDSNDVARGNNGVFVERSDGTLVVVPWDRFERVELQD